MYHADLQSANDFGGSGLFLRTIPTAVKPDRRIEKAPTRPLVCGWSNALTPANAGGALSDAF